MSYTQLTQEQRYQIYALLKTDCTQTQIAKIVRVHKSTISRELRRNKGQRGYRAKQAQQMALRRQNKARQRIGEAEWEIIDEKLKTDWSPEQVSHWVKRCHGIQVSHEWIYNHIWKNKKHGGEALQAPSTP